MADTKTYKDPVRQRLHDFAMMEGLTESSFQQQCGLSNGWFNGSSTPTGQIMSRIKTRFSRLNMEWLFTGVGNMYVGFDSSAKVRPASVPSDHIPTKADIVSDYDPPRPQPTPPPVAPTPDSVTLPRAVFDMMVDQLRQKDATISSLLSVLNSTSSAQVTPSNVLPSSSDKDETT